MKLGTSRGLTFLIIITFLLAIGDWLIQPILTLYMREVGATILEVGLMLATFSLVGTSLRIPFGLASDRFGKRTIILIALVTQFLSIIFLYLVQAPIWFYPVLAFRAILFAAYWNSATALASDMAPKGKRGEVMGQYFTAFGLAMFLGPLLCSLLTGFMSYRNILLVILTFPLTGTIVFLKTRLGKQNRESPKQFERREVSVFDSFKRIFKSKNVKTLNVIMILTSISSSIFAALFSIYAREKLLFTPSLIAILFTARGGANALIRTPTGRISDKIDSRKKPLIISYTINSLAYLTISMTDSYPILVLAMIVFGLAWGIRAVLGNTLIIENVDSRDRDLALSIYITMFDTGQIFGSTLAGAFVAFLPTAEIIKLSAFLFLPAIFATILFISDESTNLHTK